MSKPRRIDILRASCPLVITPVTGWVRPTKAAEPCSVPAENPAQEFFVPSGVPREALVQLTPAIIEITHEEFTLRCADVSGQGPVGDPVVIPAGTERETFNWADVPGISAVQLHGIAEDATLSGWLQQQTLNEENVKSRTGLSSAQSLFVATTIEQLKSNVQVALQVSALASLQCKFVSDSLTLACTSATAVRTGQYPAGDAAGAMNPVYLPQGAADSPNSQAEADARALQIARGMLVCLETNDSTVRTCAHKGFSETVPVDPDTQTSRRRIGQVVLEPGAVVADSKASANTQAAVLALNALDCFFLNTQQVVSCDSAGHPQAHVQPVTAGEGAAGNPVTVPEGYVVDEGPGASTARANTKASQVGAALLSCRYLNTEQKVFCPSLSVSGTTFTPQNPDRFVIVEAGTVEGATQAEADALAREIGLLQLDCQYCNAYVPPTCYPASYALPPDGVIPAAHVTSGWSTDVTLGLAANTLCGADIAQVQRLAESVATTPVTPQSVGCRYANDEMWFGCLLSLPGNPALPEGGYHHPAYAGNAVPPAGYEDIPFQDQLSLYCSPNPAAPQPYLVLEAGAYVVDSTQVPGGEDPKSYVNAKAVLFGLSLLDCQFGNPAMSLNCNTAYDGRFVQEEVASDGGQPVTVDMARSEFTSQLSFADAVRQAKLVAQSLLDCYYENPELTIRCWDKYGLPGELPPRTDSIKMQYGDGKATKRWVAGDVPKSQLVTLQPWQTGSESLPVIVAKGTFRSLVSSADVLHTALVSGVSQLDCSAQAQNTNVCNEAMLIFCGGMVEPNPALPFSTGVGSAVPGKSGTYNNDGLLLYGDGHNYVMTKDVDGGVRLTNLGCSSDVIGGCQGTGLYVPSCLVMAATKQEANDMAYRLSRSALSCASQEVPASVMPAAGKDGQPGAPGNDGAQNNCQGPCMAVYAQ